MPTMSLPSSHPRITDVAKELLRVVVYNTGIALFLTAVTDYAFSVNFIYSQAIGLSIMAAVFVSCALRRVAMPAPIDAIAGIPFGFALGFSLGTWANGMTLVLVLQLHPQAVLMSAAAALVFGLIATFYFYSKARLDEAESLARTEKLLRVEQEALTVKAELRLLQAQIEPHFLFNTLSVVIELVESKPAAARSMLLNLVTLLRGSLANTRRESVTLDQELDLLRAYLAIMAERMGPRLLYDVAADDAVCSTQLPPLLLQPLVENAIRHGLEPKADGGLVHIRCRLEGERLVLEVEDSGRGMSAVGKSNGVGLDNIRERLASRYGADASLELLPNPAGGITARLELPLKCAS